MDFISNMVLSANVPHYHRGIKKSSFFEAVNTRGLEQLLEVFHVEGTGSGLDREFSISWASC